MSEHPSTMFARPISRTIPWLAALAAVGVAGCQSPSVESMTAVRVSAAWSGTIDQLEYAVMSPTGAVHAPERRPSVPQGPPASDADVVIYLPDQLAGAP